MQFTALVRGLASLLAGLVFLSACVVVEEPRPRPWPGPNPGACSREYQPVCARRGDNQRTFSNACLADRAGFRVVRRGECRRGGNQSERPRFCTREYRPVCARRDGRTRTFGNACEADAAGWRIVSRNAC